MRRMLVLLIFVLVFTIALIAIPKEQYRTLTGKASQGTASVYFGIISECNIALKEGWNLVSLCTNLSNNSISSAFSDIDGQYRYVMEWNESSQEFIIFSPLAAENPLNYINENKSYFVYIVPNETALSPSGNLIDNLTVPLSFGWNGLTYPYEIGTNISNYLSTIENQYRYVMKWNSTAQKFLIYSPLAASPEFTNISVGEGQFIQVINSSGAILKYNRSIFG